MKITNRRIYSTPFSLMFSFISKLMIWLSKLPTSTLELENNALCEQLDSLANDMTQMTRSNAELEKLNSTLDETIATHKTEATKMGTVIKQRENEVREREELISEQNEKTKALESELDAIEKKRGQLEAQVNEQRMSNESETAEWMSKIEKQKQRKCSLQEQLNNQKDMEDRYLWIVIAWETGLEHSQTVVTGLRSWKEELKESLTLLEKENLRLVEACKRFESRA